jgi:integrase
VPRYFTIKKIARTGRARYYWQPNKALRAEGWTSKKLPDDLAEAYRAADAINVKLDAWRLGEVEIHPAAPKRGTVAWLIADYQDADEFRSLAYRTKRDYLRHLEKIGTWAGDLPIAAITPRSVAAYRKGLAAHPRQGNYRLQVLSVLMSYARRIGEVDSNPVSRHRKFPTPPRRAVWSSDQITSFCEHARPALRTAMMLALYTGQRQADILQLRWSDIKGGTIELRQNKTGSEVAVPIARPLADELNHTERHGLFILTMTDGRPWNGSAFRLAWRRTTERAGIGGVTFLDLRRTAVVWLADAQCTVPEIAAITGHKIADAQRIMDTYVRSTRSQARSAITKLERRI